MRKVFLISACLFPRKGPAANFLQYEGKAIRAAGYEPYIFSTLNEEYFPGSEKRLAYRGITVLRGTNSADKNMFKRHYINTIGFARQCEEALRGENISKDDIVLLNDEGNAALHKRILAMREEIGFKAIFYVAELFAFQDIQSSAGTVKACFAYRRLNKVRKKIAPRFDLVLALTTYLEDYYSRLGARTALCPPMLCDTSEYPFVPKELDSGTYRFILPAAGKMKDDLPSMLRGFAALDPGELQKAEFHLCGVAKKTAESILTEEEQDKVKDRLIIHSWLKYDELIALFQKMHFMFLARKESQMTRANFPSKVPEVMQFGVVPIVSPVGDYTKYYLRDMEDSIFINGSSPETCRDAFRKALALSREEYLRLSENAVATAKTRFDVQALVPAWKEILDDL